MTIFTRQQKLSLALTSAGSQRALARELGVSHQQVGRWLREGEALSIDTHGNMPRNKDGSIKEYGEIPEWIAQQLNWVFERHCKICREQAYNDGFPYNATVPIYIERRWLNNKKYVSDWFNTKREAQRYAKQKHGAEWQSTHQIEFNEKYGIFRVRKLGDRVISGPTEFIRGDQRHKWIRGMVASQAFYKINVRSVIDLKKYSLNKAKEVMSEGAQQGRIFSVTPRVFANQLLTSWIGKESREQGRIIDKAEPFPFYTRSVDASPGAHPSETANDIENYLAEKHSPAVGGKGTHFADEYLLQLLPASYDANNRKPASRSRAAAKRARTHPNK